MGRGVFYGVGVGPGDPELLTLKAVKILKTADLVVVPQTGWEKESIAYAIAKEHLRENCRLLPFVFPMTKDKELLEKSWDRASERIQGYLEQGENAVFLTIGDPMLYSTYIYLFKRLSARGYTVYTIPGVPSFCAAASAAGITLGEGEEKIAIIPWNDGEKLPPETLRQFASVVIMKASGNINGILEALGETGFLEKSILVSKCGYEDERIEKDLTALRGTRVPYFSLILAKKEVDKK
jgi:precorrin-2/cobalt-factor-2 C20-methyltransferase